MITVDALQDRVLWGKVTKISPLADSQRMWFNPDLKVYSTDVLIDSATDDLRPGMSAMVEIIVAKLKSVLTVPIQTVSLHDGVECCYVLNGDGIELRAVKLGLANDKHVVVEDGVKENERVLLHPPDESAKVLKIGIEEAKKQKETEKAEKARQEPGPGDPEAAGTQPPGPGTDRPSDGPPEGKAPSDRQKRLESMTPEQRETMRKRWREASPEQRKEMRERSERRPQ
jgi:hypothetical protein